MANYKILRKEGEDTLFEKSGYTHEFLASAFPAAMQKMAKVKKQLEAQLRLNKAEMENILHFHPFVKDISEDDRNTIFLFQRSAITAKETEDQLKKIAEAEEANLADMKEIEEQTGFKFEIPDPNQVVITAEQLGLKPEAENGEAKPENTPETNQEAVAGPESTAEGQVPAQEANSEATVEASTPQAVPVEQYEKPKEGGQQ